MHKATALAGLLATLASALMTLIQPPEKRDAPAHPQRPPVVAPQPAEQIPPAYLELVEATVYDGDTLHDAEIDLGFDGLHKHGVDIRLLGFDAWESTRRRRSVEITDEELVRGRIAARALRRLLQSAQDMYITPGELERDNYGRVLAYLWVVNRRGHIVDVAAWMEAQGHVRRPNAKIMEKYAP